MSRADTPTEETKGQPEFIDLQVYEKKIARTFEEIQGTFIDEVLRLFKSTNYAVLLLVVGLAILDEVNIFFSPGHTQVNRIISPNIIMALIGATTIQVGTIAITIANYLFKNPRNPGR